MTVEHVCATGCGRPAPDTRLCRTCLDGLLADLRTIGEHRVTAHGEPDRTLIDELHLTYAHGTRRGTRVGSRSSVVPLPWHDGAADVITELHATLRTWVARLMVANERSDTGIRHTVNAPDYFAAWLLRHPTWIAQHDHAAALYRDVTHAVSRAWRVIDWPADRWYAGPCDRGDCAGQVFGEPDGDIAICVACRTRYDMPERRAFLLDTARRYAMTAAEISRAMPVLYGIEINRKTITTWATRGRLAVIGYEDTRGWPLYRLGDVQDLILRDATPWPSDVVESTIAGVLSARNR